VASRVAHEVNGRRSLLDESRRRLEGMDLCSQMQWLDFTWYLPSDILTKVDIASMSCGLEVRVPLLDHEVVELAARIPSSLKVRQIDDGEATSKYLLRRVAARHVPAQVLTGAKKGFGLPVRRWCSPEKRAMLANRLLASNAPLRELFRPEGIRPFLQEGHEERNASRLWSLLVLDEWLSQRRSRRYAASRNVPVPLVAARG